LGNDRILSSTPAVRLYRVAENGVDGEWENANGPEHSADAQRVRHLRRAILIQHLVDCLERGTPPVLSAEHARHTLEIILAAEISAATGERIELTTTF
jgi:predicted dehydrogenase